MGMRMVYSSYSLMMFHFLEYFELFTAQYACFLVTYAEVTSDQHRQRSYCCVCVCVCVYVLRVRSSVYVLSHDFDHTLDRGSSSYHSIYVLIAILQSFASA